MSIGEKIQNERRHYKLTLAEVAQNCGMSVSHLSDIEHGRHNPSLLTAEKIANFFGNNLSAFLLGVSVQ